MSLRHFPEADESNPCVSPGRRRVLAGLGGVLGALAWGGAGGRAGAAAWPFSRSSGASSGGLDAGALDAEWVRRQGRELGVYGRYLETLRLRNISVQRVVAAHAKRRGAVWNSLPPRAAWRCIGPTLKVLDRVSMELDAPVTEVLSVYRAPAYNARCPGARSGSWHMRNYAVDVKMGARPSEVAAMARRLRDRGLFRGGVGRYGTFTHVDTRGTNIDW